VLTLPPSLAEARNEYKSFVAPFIADSLSAEQKANQVSYMEDLNSNLLRYIGRNRFPNLPPTERLAKIKALSLIGPFTAGEATKHGLLNGVSYRQDLLDSILLPAQGGKDTRKLKGFAHYAETMQRYRLKNVTEYMDVGVVYLLGSIGDAGEFGTSAVVRGLREAGKDP
jgi:hypothetical protein